MAGSLRQGEEMTKLWLAAFAAVGTATFIVAPSNGASAQAAPNGATVFQQRCSSCHAIAAGKPATLGPNLAGVVGRKAGTASYNYSAAMKKSDITWTKPSLEKYLTGPAKMVPGTKMMVSLSDAKQRAAVVDYLSKAQ